MDTATLIVLVMLVLGIGSIWLGSTVGVPGAVKEPPRPKLKPAMAVAGAPRPGMIQQQAFAREAAYAVGARGLTPALSPDDSVGMQMKVLAGVATSALVILVLGAYVIWEPIREADASQRQLHENVLLAANLFTLNCARCHGPNGQGLIGPNLHLTELAGRYKYNPNDPSDMAKLRTLVVNTITRGRPGTLMPTWGDTDGGPLNESQISNLADLIMTNGWQYVVPAPAAPGATTAPAAGAAPAASTTPAPGATPAPAAGGTTAPAAGGGAAGQALLTKYGCVACHTIASVPGAVGTIGPNLSHIASVPKIPESTGNLENNPANLKKWILNAPQIKPGIVMPDFQQQGMSDADAQAIVDYLETLK